MNFSGHVFREDVSGYELTNIRGLKNALYRYQETREYFAQIAGGIEDLGCEEVTSLGASNATPSYRGLWFEADHDVLYKTNYCSRLITRILAPLVRFKCHNTDYLYRQMSEVEWTDFMSVDDTFAIFSNVSNSKIRHSKYAALRVKDAIADYFRQKTGKRPSVNKINPDVWFHIDVRENIATLSLETSGGSLHRRGYRKSSGRAPIQETVAAAIILMTEWDGEAPLYDPMCGSGTLLAEALMKYCRIPAAYLRSSFGFERLVDFDSSRWATVKHNCDKEIRPLPAGLIRGSDIDTIALENARRNLSALPGGRDVELHVANWQSIQSLEESVIVTNPPYGKRINSREPIDSFYKSFGDFLKNNCKGSTAFLYVGERELLKKVGLRTTWKKPLVNGALDGRLAKYEMY